MLGADCSSPHQLSEAEPGSALCSCALPGITGRVCSHALEHGHHVRQSCLQSPGPGPSVAARHPLRPAGRVKQVFPCSKSWEEACWWFDGIRHHQAMLCHKAEPGILSGTHCIKLKSSGRACESQKSLESSNSRQLAYYLPACSRR